MHQMTKFVLGACALAGILAVAGCGGSSSSASDAATPAAPLADGQKYALAYMWHEEKLAYDLYLALNDVQPAVQLSNIATRSESAHIAAVEALIETYDINITNLEDYTVRYSETELRAMPSGVFAIEKIQALYDALYAKGVRTQRDALEVGCMVEVTDVDDLNEYIDTCEDREDIVISFEELRRGSYNHYWAFDAALKALGVTDGCCGFDGGTYCKTEAEYPASHGM